MQPLPVGGGGLDRVPERVTKIEQRPLVGLALVAADDRSLDLARAADDVGERGGIALEQALQVRLEPGKKRRIADQSVLDHLGEPRAQLARRQAAERTRCRDYQHRLVKRADQVLAAGVIDAGLATDCRVHLREQCRRHLHERDPALIAGCGKPGEVADYPAAERHHGAITGEAVGHQHIEHACGVGERLVRFAVRQDDFDDAARAEALHERRQIQRRNSGVADD